MHLFVVFILLSFLIVSSFVKYIGPKGSSRITSFCLMLIKGSSIITFFCLMLSFFYLCLYFLKFVL